MSKSILDLVRQNTSIQYSKESKTAVAVENNDVVVNIDQLRDAEGSLVDTANSPESDLLKAQDLGNAVDAQTPAIDTITADTAALEANRVLLKRAANTKGGIDMQAAGIIRINIDKALGRRGLTASSVNVPSTESFGGTDTTLNSTNVTVEKLTQLVHAHRTIAVESAMIQNDANEQAIDAYVEVAEGLQARARKLEGVVANIQGAAPEGNVEIEGLASKIGSTNGSVGTAATNLATYVTGVLGTGAKQYNAIGNALAEVEAAVDPVVDTTAEPTTPAVETEAVIDDVADAAEVGADNTPAVDPAADDTAVDAAVDTKQASTENVDKDLLVNEDGTEKQVAKPEDEDVATSETPAEAAEGTVVADTLPSTESDDPSVTDVVDNINTDADLPGDATVEFVDSAAVEETVGGDEPDLVAGAAQFNAADVEISGGNYAGTSLPILGQAEALLITRAVDQICQAVIDYEPIANARGGVLQGIHDQVDETGSGELDEDAVEGVGQVIDFNISVGRKVSEAERAVIDHALRNAKDLLAYVAQSCKSYTDAPAAPVVEAPADATDATNAPVVEEGAQPQG